VSDEKDGFEDLFGFEMLKGMPSPIRSSMSAATYLTQAFGAGGWGNSIGYFSPAWNWCAVTVTFAKSQVIRTGWGVSPEHAFLKAFELLGGKVEYPKEMPRVEVPPAALPKPQQRQTAPSIGSSLPSSYQGPVPYNDSNTNIPPVAFSKPPQKPDWFRAPIGGYGTKKAGSWDKTWTWEQLVDQEVSDPKGRDNALGFIQWKLGKDAPSFDGPNAAGMKKAWENFVGRAKSACIWAMLAIQAKQAEAVEDYAVPADLEPDDSVPF
jgi:hypothetical protein